MISSDLSTLFRASAGGVNFRQGTVVEWDAATGENTIDVGGAALVNIPSLTSESASLQPGDVVMMLASGNTWFLLGKVTTPGDPDTVPSWPSDIEALTPLTELAAVTSGTTVTGATLATPEVTEGIITGTVIQTSPSGTRVVLGSDDPVHTEWKDQILMYTGEADSPDPAVFQSSGFTDYAQLVITGPPMPGLVPPSVNLYSNVASDDAGATFYGYTFRVEDPDGGVVTMTQGGIAADGAITSAGKAVMTVGTNPQPVSVTDATTLSAQALSTTYAAGGTVCGTSFTAPPSGKVYVSVGGRIRSETNNNTMYLGFEVRAGATVGSGTVVMAADNGRAIAAGANATSLTYIFAGGSRRFLVTGLTPGNPYNVRTMHACQSTTATGTVFNRDLLIEPVL